MSELVASVLLEKPKSKAARVEVIVAAEDKTVVVVEVIAVAEEAVVASTETVKIGLELVEMAKDAEEAVEEIVATERFRKAKKVVPVAAEKDVEEEVALVVENPEVNADHPTTVLRSLNKVMARTCLIAQKEANKENAKASQVKPVKSGILWTASQALAVANATNADLEMLRGKNLSLRMSMSPRLKFVKAKK